ncbi:MAG: DUF3298 domain-containing protein [Lachnospiraceae bacterium]|nr:DUF3298 domain-containing protein [Lachnospiraceae bacterium]
MKKARLLFVMCLLVFTFVLAACNKNGELDLKSIIDTGTPTPEATATPEPTATAEPTKEVTPTAEPTAEPTEEPTAEPTAEPTEEPTPTEPEVTEEPTPSVIEDMFSNEDTVYDIPELLTLGTYADGDSEWGDGNKLYEVSLDMLVLSDEDKEKYPNLALQFDLMNMEYRDVAKFWTEKFKDLCDGGYALEGDQYYFVRDNYNILRADSYVVSLADTGATYEGGVHPDYGTIGVSIDTETGEQLTVKDICNDWESLGTMIAYKLNEKYGLWEDDSKIDELISYIDEKIDEGSQSFTIGYEGVTFYFTPYEIATYADGELTVTFSLDETFVAQKEDGPEMMGLFKRKYRRVPERYMLQITPGTGVELLDLVEENDNFDELTICEIPNEKYHGTSNGHYILLNGNEIFRKDEIYSDSNDNAYFYIKVGDRKYIIVKTVQGSDDTYTYVYNLLDNGNIYDWTEDGNEFGFEFAGLRDYYGDGLWDYHLTSQTIYDPENTVIESRFDVIGTNFVTKKIKFNYSGDEVYDYASPYYDFTGRWELTLKKDFKAGMIDPELMFNGDENVTGEMDMEVELQAGDVIYLEKCTADKQVFFSTDNGEWGTFIMDKPADYDGEYFYSRTIGGEDIDDLFEGISYAD